MKTTQILSALVLALTLTTISSSLTYAESNAEAGIMVQAENSNLQKSISRAEEVLAEAEKHPEQLYPGVKTYLNNKIALAKDIASGAKSGNANAMIQVLDEASEATSLMLKAEPAPKASTVVKSQITAHADDNEITETTTPEVITQNTTPETKTAVANSQNNSQNELIGATVRVTVADEKVNTAAEANADEITTHNNETEKQAETTPENTQDVELPNTGETKSASVTTLIIAGIAVVAVTAGVSAMILKGKRNA